MATDQGVHGTALTRGVLGAVVGVGVVLMVLEAVTGGFGGAASKTMAVLGLAGLSIVAWSELHMPWWLRVAWSLVAVAAALLASVGGLFALDLGALLVFPAAALVLVLGVPTWLVVVPRLAPRRRAAHLAAAAVVAGVFAWTGPPWPFPPRRFGEARWRTTREAMRIAMACDAVDRGLLVGLPEAELRRLLGPPVSEHDGHLIWIVGEGLADPLLLDVGLEDGRAVSAVVRSG